MPVCSLNRLVAGPAPITRIVSVLVFVRRIECPVCDWSLGSPLRCCLCLLSCPIKAEMAIADSIMFGVTYISKSIREGLDVGCEDVFVLDSRYR